LTEKSSINNVARVLGRGTSKISVVSSITFALITVFYLYTIGSYIAPTIYVFQNRVTYIRFFIDVYILNEYVDHLIISIGLIIWVILNLRGVPAFAISGVYVVLILISVLTGIHTLLDITALFSLPLMISLLLIRKARPGAKKIIIFDNTSIDTSVCYLAILSSAAGIAFIVTSITPIFSIAVPIRNYAYEVYVLLSSSLSSILIVLLTLSLPLKLLIDQLTNKIRKFKRNLTSDLTIENGINKKPKKVVVFYLALFMLLSVVLVIIPHQPSLNKQHQQIGVDTHYYLRWIGILAQAKNIPELLQQSFVIQSGGDRPVTLLFVLLIMKMTHLDLLYIVEYLPVILGPALILVVYFLTRQLVSNETISLLASFLSTVSFQILIGIYTGFYANWLALIIGYLSIVFLFRYLRTPNKVNIAAYSVTLCLLLFAHIYTWTIFIIVIVAFLSIILKLRYYSVNSIVLLFIPLVATVAVDVVRLSITGSYSGILQDMDAAARLNTGPEQFVLRWNNLIDATYISYGGLFGNFIILSLVLYWLYRSNLKSTSTIFLVIFLSVSSLTLFFGDWQLQNRVRYDIPFQMPAAIALFYIRSGQRYSNIIFCLIIIILIGLSIRAASNFYLINPPSI
jgi:hypothetical protein